ncbi:TnsA endonuclease N-terminal domain-containing protein [Metallibacterium scheffleri]|uniref:TnsA endonuclease N-terminal domain-containing protein n=1 Tax=Metallibacterium scheffleri TaxID=993689 RepID=A0A4S3KME6_9GAMM|nr:TnsA endonuclease N-terminal domain-containing protein [Metallibacterium scheffleri]THD10073.1 hypothetical protein B1806_09385 [Metallibacterium scheffleri]
MPSKATLRRWLPEKGTLFEGSTRVIGPSRYAVTGRIATRKSPASQDAESSLEHDFMLLVDFDSRVETFSSQPITLRWEDDGGRHRYTPDVAIRYSAAALRCDPLLRTTLVEVKPRDVLKRDWTELRPLFRGAVAWTRNRSMAFKILTEREIRTVYLDNVRFLQRFRRSDFASKQALDGPVPRRVRTMLAELGASTPQALLRAITSLEGEQAQYLPWLWAHVCTGLIGCDLSQPLTMASGIWPLEVQGVVARNET